MSRHKTPSIAPKIKASIEHLLHQEHFDLAEAAKVGGITTERLRDDLNRPHVRKYLRDQRRTQIESVCVRNPIVLAEIRDRGRNEMARVAAIKASEALRQSAIEENGAGASTRPAPGLVIVLQTLNGEKGVTVEAPQRLAGAKTVESIAYEREPDNDDLEDEALAVPPAGRRVRP
jgi:hypothetical protein